MGRKAVRLGILERKSRPDPSMDVMEAAMTKEFHSPGVRRLEKTFNEAPEPDKPKDSAFLGVLG